MQDLAVQTEVEQSRLAEGILVLDLFAEVGLIKSKGEARRNLAALKVNGEKVPNIELKITEDHLTDGEIVLKFGKKKFHRVITA